MPIVPARHCAMFDQPGMLDCAIGDFVEKLR
jgi:hypothetical protein